jgi:hypothetical protein
MKLTNPLLINFETFLQFHDLPKTAQMHFAYYGDNLFSLKTFTEPTFCRDIYHYHSRSTTPLITAIFDVVLTPRSVGDVEMVQIFFTLFKSFFHM